MYNMQIVGQNLCWPRKLIHQSVFMPSCSRKTNSGLSIMSMGRVAPLFISHANASSSV